MKLCLFLAPALAALVATAKDFETGEPVASAAAGEFSFRLKKHNFKAVLVE